MRLSNKVAIITGASSGIGHSAAKLFAAEGAKLVLSARRESLLENLCEEIERAGGRAVFVAGDIQDEDHVASLVETAEQEYGCLDIAFNNAGIIGAGKNIEALTLSEWQHTISTNLTSGFLSGKYQIPAMKRNGGGSIIYTSSFVGETAAIANHSDYAVTKSGLIALAKSLAVETGEFNIRVNALLPGGTDTPMNFANAPDAAPEMLDYLNGIHALKRMADPDEIARAALFLASDDASFVTGSALLADGGVSLTK